MNRNADERKQRKKNATKIRKTNAKGKSECSRAEKSKRGENAIQCSPLLRFECAYELHVLRGECIDFFLELNHATGRMDVEGAIFLARVVELTGQLRSQGFEIA